jgi:hypothetical protein
MLILFLGCSAAATTTGNGAFRSLAGTGICAGILTAQRQVSAMAQATITADFDQAFDVHLNFTAQITFDS